MKATEIIEHLIGHIAMSNSCRSEREIPLSSIVIEIDGEESSVEELLTHKIVSSYRNKTGRELKATIRNVARQYDGLEIKFTKSAMKIVIPEFSDEDDETMEFKEWLEAVSSLSDNT